MTATAMWAPIIAWCAIETLAESIDAEHPERVALDIFDQLRLRKPLGESFAALGFEGESAWRAAARIKVLLLAQKESAAQTEEPVSRKSAPASSISTESPAASDEQLGSRAQLASAAPNKEVREGKSAPPPRPTPAPSPIVAGLPRALWSDPDVRWLTGVHDAGESSYLVQEPFEELLWWLQMPSILHLASQASFGKSDTDSFCTCIGDSLAEVEKAGYKLQTLLGINAAAEIAEERIAVEGSPKTEEKNPSASDLPTSANLDEPQEQPTK